MPEAKFEKSAPVVDKYVPKFYELLDEFRAELRKVGAEPPVSITVAVREPGGYILEAKYE